MNTIEKLLKVNASEVKKLEKDVKIKLKRLGGQEFVFHITEVPYDDYAEMQSAMLEGGADMGTLKNDIILAACDLFKNNDLLKHFGCAIPYDLIEKLMTSGEVDKLFGEIIDLGGYDEIEKKSKKK